MVIMGIQAANCNATELLLIQVYLRAISGQRHSGCHFPNAGETNVIDAELRDKGGNLARSTTSSWG